MVCYVISNYGEDVTNPDLLSIPSYINKSSLPVQRDVIRMFIRAWRKHQTIAESSIRVDNLFTNPCRNIVLIGKGYVFRFNNLFLFGKRIVVFIAFGALDDDKLVIVR